jgi:NAD(P)-dependent dehydrogenase (short-subunit alcohol dehydrogenase family)
LLDFFGSLRYVRRRTGYKKSDGGTVLATRNLAGKVALVTGGTRGIGLAIAEALFEAGIRVVVCGREARDLPPGIDFIACDVRDPEAVKAMIAEIVASQGGLDFVVNNAGGSPPAHSATASPRFSERVIQLNLLAPLHVCQAAYVQLQARKGAIVNIASVSGIRPSPGTVAYGAAKAGLLSLTQSLAHEWGPDIRVNALILGYIETETTDATYGDEQKQAAIARNLAAGRLGKAAEIAEAVKFLLSPAASYITGAALAVHGGGERPPFLDIVNAR